MPGEVLTILNPGLGASIQDHGRIGWRRFGVPSSGAMDDHAANWANRLLENPPDAPVVEMLMQGAKFTARAPMWIAMTGADAQATVPQWRAVQLNAGDAIEFPRHRSGVWIYLAIDGGFAAEKILGSASTYQRGGLGSILRRGDVLCRRQESSFQLVPSIAGRSVVWSERRNYDSPPPLRVWRGPQWSSFAEADRNRFFAQPWAVSAQSDRTGYRLEGKALTPNMPQIISEPVRLGTIQIPASGQPIVIMRDGPTVGGYPKLGMIDPADLSWLAQCQPGQNVRFQSVE